MQQLFAILQVEFITFLNLLLTNKYDRSNVRCFEEIGCFGCEPPFSNYLYRPVCAVPEVNTNISYLLYNRQYFNQPYPLEINSTSTSPFDASLPTEILIPGFNTTLQVDFDFYLIKDEFLKRKPCNVIIVDWTSVDNYPYIQAVANGRKVGALLALLLTRLKENKGCDYRKVHIIGLSLGAHVAGWAGERLNKIGRITGLDPAGPYFENAPNEVRLDTTDAEFVDIIHTNDGVNLVEGFGLKQAIGHIDFYANGGNQQPFCGTKHAYNVYDVNVCNHALSLKYFRTSINDCKFPSVLCSSFANTKNGQCTCNNSVINYMGYHAKKPNNQENTLKFYLNTTASLPFCKDPNKCPVSEDLNGPKDPIVQLFIVFVSVLLFIVRGGLLVFHLLGFI